MVVVLVAAGAFVFWRVQVALDNRLERDLTAQTRDLRRAAARQTPAAALASVRDQAPAAQLLTADGVALASGPEARNGQGLLSAAQVRRAAGGEVRKGHGHLFSKPGRHLRIMAIPVTSDGAAAVAVTAVRLDQRDEALRELLAQLAIANLLALALASAVGLRLARGALDPVERYRAQAEQIGRGATGLRLDVPEGPSDEITRLGATLNDMLDAQGRSAERQQQFIDDASHELRTPLSTLSAEIDVALRKPRTSEEHEATLRRLAADTSRLVGLTENLLALGPLGSTVPDVKAVGGADVIAAAARRARGQLNGDGARKVEVRAPDDLVVQADRALLERALGNLVDNAVRHGDGAITLTVAPLEGLGEPAAILSVHDQGAGIDAGFLTHAAERFRQAESSRAGPGAGLGLSLVDAILAAHRGQLRICSAGRHHQQPTSDSALARVPCAHPADGTTISLLLGPDDDQV